MIGQDVDADEVAGRRQFGMLEPGLAGIAGEDRNWPFAGRLADALHHCDQLIGGHAVGQGVVGAGGGRHHRGRGRRGAGHLGRVGVGIDHRTVDRTQVDVTTAGRDGAAVGELAGGGQGNRAPIAADGAGAIDGRGMQRDRTTGGGDAAEVVDHAASAGIEAACRGRQAGATR